MKSFAQNASASLVRVVAVGVVAVGSVAVAAVDVAAVAVVITILDAVFDKNRM